MKFITATAIFLLLSSFGTAILDPPPTPATARGGVPGCECKASTCTSDFDPFKACAFLENFADSIDNTRPICDALENSTDFMDTYGEGAQTLYFGRYYDSGLLPYLIRSGTCDETVEEQLTCAHNISNGFAISGVTTQRDPMSCHSTSKLPSLPNTNTTVAFTIACTSWYDDSVTSGHNDELAIFVTLGDSDAKLCDRTTDAVPTLTSKDWIEPEDGRRFMCHEFTDPNDASATYSALFLSLGNAPCDGPKPEPDVGGETNSGGQSGLSTTQLVGIVVGSIVAFCVISL